jgi:hypothetical protein
MAIIIDGSAPLDITAMELVKSLPYARAEQTRH